MELKFEKDKTYVFRKELFNADCDRLGIRNRMNDEWIDRCDGMIVENTSGFVGRTSGTSGFLVTRSSCEELGTGTNKELVFEDGKNYVFSEELWDAWAERENLSFLRPITHDDWVSLCDGKAVEPFSRFKGLVFNTYIVSREDCEEVDRCLAHTTQDRTRQQQRG